MYRAINAMFVSLALMCTPTASAAWYDGGTLHQKSLGEWAVATQKNKLATSGDLAARAKLSNNIDELKVWAGGIMSCIDEVAVDTSSHSQEVTTIAALCILLLKDQ